MNQHGPVTGDLVPNIFGIERRDILVKVVIELGQNFGDLEDQHQDEPMPLSAIIDTLTHISENNQLTLLESAALAYDLGIFTRTNPRMLIKGELTDIVGVDDLREVLSTMTDIIMSVEVDGVNFKPISDLDTLNTIIEACTKCNIPLRGIIALSHDFGLFENKLI